jgi:hypothetical protein
MKKANIIFFLLAFVLSALTLGSLRIAKMPEEIIKRSLDGFEAMEVVDEVKMVAPLNQFAHSDLFTAESDANFAGFTFPIADILYSIAWLDISEEPIIVSVPELGGRYYAICFTDLLNRNSGYIGTRATGGDAGRFAVVPPDWQGELPEGITRFEVSTPQVNAFIRTFVGGPDDLATADALRRQVTLTPLSQILALQP